MPITWTDGTINLFGTPIITLLGVSFQANDIGGSAPIATHHLLDGSGTETKGVGVRKLKTGTYTIQCDNTTQLATASIAVSMSVALGEAMSGSAFHAWITNREISRATETFATVTLNWTEKLNA